MTIRPENRPARAAPRAVRSWPARRATPADRASSAAADSADPATLVLHRALEVGVEAPLEAAGVQTRRWRWREPGNGRVQRVELTPEGQRLVERLREVAVRHDERLRSQLSEEEVRQLAELLERLSATVQAPGGATASG